MRKIAIITYTTLLAILINFAIVQSTYAQKDTTIKSQKIVMPDFGVKFGVGLSSMNNDGESMQYLLSYSGGIFKNFDINKNFSIRAEALFSSKGGRTDNLNTGDTASTVIDFTNIYTITSISYAEIPIMLRLKGDGFAAMLGPYLGVKVLDSFDHNIPKLKQSKERPEFSMFDFGITGGLEFPIYKRTLIDVRFSYGLTSPIQEVPKYISGFYSDKMNNFTIQVGFLFGL